MKKSILTISIILLAVFNLSAQNWTDNLDKAKLQKGELTLRDYEKAFNDYWEPYNVKDGYYYENGEKIKAPGWKLFQRWDWKMNIYCDAEGHFPTTTTSEELQKYYNKYPDASRSTSGNWTNLGFNYTSGGYQGIGRINTIAFHPTDNNTFWIGSPAGGLWKTTDGGSTWTVLTDDLEVLGVSAIAITSDYATSNTIYIGTGDRDGHGEMNSGMSHQCEGIGVLKSTDGGMTWSNTGLSFSQSNKLVINDLLIDPNDNNTIYAATNEGLYKTTDGGTNWPKLVSQGFIDIEFKPGDPSIMYGAKRDLLGDGHIYRSTDGGVSFTTISLPGSSSRRTELAVSADDPTVVYALTVNSSRGLEGVYKSTDSGASFTLIYSVGGGGNNLLGYDCNDVGTSGQGTYDLFLTANPNDANDVYAGGINIWRTTTGGTSWSIKTHWSGTCGSTVETVHADQHACEFQNGGTVFIGNDGGIYKTANNGSNWTDLTSGLTISQIYRIGVSTQSNDEIINGLQDNGTHLYSGGVWLTNGVIGGDGMECLIDPTDDNVQFGELPRGGIKRTSNHWWSKIDVRDNIRTAAGDPNLEGDWLTPYTLDPNNNNILFVGYEELWKSTDQGVTSGNFSQISNFGTGTEIKAIQVAPSNSNYIYIGFDHNLYKTTNGGTSWTEITGTLPIVSNALTYITVKEDDENTVWVSMGGFNSNAVYETTDGGTTWTNISTGLPNLPAMSIIQNTQNTTETELYVSMSGGVWVKVGNSIWNPFNANLPAVFCSELDVYYDNTSPSNSKLRVGTFGRGLWESDLYSAGTLPPNADFTADYTTPNEGQKVTFSDLTTNYPTSWTWSFNPGTVTYVDGTSSSSQNPKVVFNAGGTYTVSLTATNAYGSDTKTKTDYISVCPAITSYPYIQDFDSWTTSSPAKNCTADGTVTLEDCWTNVLGDDIDWDIYTGATGSPSTGPSSDHTGGGNYLYTESSSCYGSTGHIMSPTFNLTSFSQATLTFWYHMYGSSMGTMSVQISTDGGSTWSTDVWNLSGNQGNSWQQATVSLDDYISAYTVIRFTGLTGSSYYSDMAIDDITVDGIPDVADTWTGATSTDWNTGSNWDDGGVPTNIVDVTIPASVTNWPEITGNFTLGTQCKDISMAGASELTINGNFTISTGRSLTIGADATIFVGGDWTNNGTFTPGTGTVELFGTSPSVINVPAGTSYLINDDFSSWPGNWNGDIGTGDGQFDQSLTNNAGGSSPEAMFTYETATTGTRRLYYNPVNTSGLTSLTLDFRHMVDDFDGSQGYTVKVQYSTDGTNWFDSDWSASPTGDIGPEQVSTTLTSALHGVGAPNYYISFTITGNLENINYWYIDDVKLHHTVSGETFYNLVIGKEFAETTTNGNINVDNDLTLLSGAWFTNSAGNTLEVTGNVLLQADNFGTASFIDNGTTNYGDASVESYITQDKWHFVSAPVNNAQSDVFTDMYLMRFDETDYTWHYITSLNYDLTEGKSFTAWSQSGTTGNATITYTGTLNNGDLTVNGLSYTASQPEANRGWNMVGNPYPSAIHLNNNWTRTNVDATAYIYDGANYLTWNLATNSGTHANGDVAVGQGFWVKANAAGASITIPQSERKHSTQQFYKANRQLNQLLLTVEGNGYSDKMIIEFNNESTAGFDSELDAWKFKGRQEAPQLYSVSEQNNLTVNVLPFEDQTMIIPVNFEASAENNYTITTSGIDNFDEYTAIWIEDLKDNKMVDLRQNPSYTFDAKPDDASNRFLLHFKKSAIGTEEHSSSNFNIYSYGKRVYVIVPSLTKGNIKVYNLMGQEIKNVSINSTITTITLNKSAYYVVVAKGDKTVTTKKVFIE